ncbi:hypothetical protein PR048_022914 [Dryococelus australis]|uniref:Uncharacterized protein n=1 Tax=Dryococelus australis TaxID=614101 RepID=A0ABQ9GSQ4_9NEOP|nr:hypothetical protein PR048_022914 [Dryococelus australis]
MDNEKFILCDCILGNVKTVVMIRGLEGIVIATKTRDDGLWEKLVEIQEIKVHVGCREVYTRPRSITAAKRRTTDNEQQEGACAPVIRPASSFKYKNCCLQKNRRNRVTKIETFEIKQSILDKCDERKNTFSEVVKSRVRPIDLIAGEARYHHKFYVSLRNFTGFVKSGRPLNEEHDEILKLLFEYIESHDDDECRYSFLELHEIIETFLGGDICDISDYVLRTRLRDHFKNRVVIAEASGRRHSLICFSLRIVEMTAEIIRQDIRGKTFNLT